MLLNNLKIAYRYLLKNRTFSVINIFGLSLGFFCFTLLSLYLHDELTFDMFHRDAPRIYRVLQHEQQENGNKRTVASVASRLGPEAVKQIPGVEDAVRIFGMGRLTLGNEAMSRDYEQLITIDPNYFNFFDFEMIEGDKATALTQPDAIVLSQTLAKKYFGTEAALGKSLWSVLQRNGENIHFTVSGVIKDPPKNSHLQIDLVFSQATWPTYFSWYTEFENTDWKSNNFTTYLKLQPLADPKQIEEKLTTLVQANFPAEEEFKSSFTLQALADIHQNSAGIQGAELDSNGIKPFYLYMFAAIAFLLLLIACLNYMNLSTAAAYKRTREIGTRKTLGALKTQLIGQFTSEAIILSAISFLVALALLQVLLPAINVFTEKNLSLSTLPVLWMIGITAIIFMAGLLSSLYPAFIVARVQPAEAIKKEVKLGRHSLPVRKILVVAQFTISITMIASTLVIYQQLQFMRTKELGFNLDNLLVIDINSGNLRRDFENVKAEFASVGEVKSISTSTRVPGEWKNFPVASVHPSGETLTTEMIFVGIDNDFLNTYNIRLLEGRNFAPGVGDSSKIILTKMAVEQLGLTEPLGQIIEIPTVRWGGNIDQLDQPFRAEVIGVVDNFYFESFRKEMMPLIFAAPNTPIQRIDYYTLRIETANWPETLEKLKVVNTRIDPENPIEYTFLDSRFEEFYKADEKRGQIFLTFASIIILIACLGLFALVSYSVESRIKEIGVRKVLGASVSNIVSMISKEFLSLIVIASVLAIPMAYFFMQQWLQDFAYRITLGVGIFLLAGLVTVLIALATISLRTVKAATANPVKSLRTE